jgi:hypothetical protein
MDVDLESFRSCARLLACIFSLCNVENSSSFVLQNVLESSSFVAKTMIMHLPAFAARRRESLLR